MAIATHDNEIGLELADFPDQCRADLALFLHVIESGADIVMQEMRDAGQIRTGRLRPCFSGSPG
jgi:hypothetical protein